MDAWGPSHIRLELHSRRRGSSSLLVSDAKRTRRSTGCGTGGASENEQIRESERRSWSHRHLSAAQWTVWPKVRPRSSASLRGTSEQSAKQLVKTEDDHCKSGKKLLSMALARCTATTVLSATAHQGLERNVARTSLFFSHLYRSGQNHSL